ncbi:MAG: glycoside hydrolase, partial [Anaerolineae bacterium]|nr:glycoside hydrolase [Anaerolineae bacterium]
RALAARQPRLPLRELALLDVDGERLELIGGITAPLEERAGLSVTRTTDARTALAGADFVLTTFRVGGMEARVVDERVPLAHGVLGQETTGPGGFAMALRSIPVLLRYVEQMRELCPDAWLINFANPSGMMAEAVTRAAAWPRTVGICDGPSEMHHVVAAALGAEVYLDYFGLNHLGWVRAVRCSGQDLLPGLLAMFQEMGPLPGFPFDPGFVAALGLLPNEYLYYYYYTRRAVERIQAAGRTRGEQVLALNEQLFAALRKAGNAAEMAALYEDYLRQRGESYMVTEAGPAGPPRPPALLAAASGGGYADVALDLIEALSGRGCRIMVLNVPNQGAIAGMEAADVVEVPTHVGAGVVQPLAVGAVPAHCLGLMLQVKAYERLTIAAATEGSYEAARQALALHPLVPGADVAKKILDDYRERHGAFFPALA